jgi:hypothetical protein
MEKVRKYRYFNKMLNAVKSLYCNVTSCVRVNSVTTDWFPVNSGVRQGCSLSSILLNIYNNDLALLLKNSIKDISINEDIIAILLYADDIVLIAENEENLQCMLNLLSNWCTVNSMTINVEKSNV